jgi:hypothetical protein
MVIWNNTNDLYQAEKDFSGYETHPFEKVQGQMDKGEQMA